MAGKDDLNLGKDKDGEDVPKRGGKGKLIAVLAVGFVLLAAGGGAAWLFLGGEDDAPKTVSEEPATPLPPKAEKRDALYAPLEKLLVNLDQKGNMRYVQVEIELMAYTPDAIEQVKGNMPVVRNRLIMLLNMQDFDVLRSAEGKEALRKDMLKTTNEALKLSGPDAVQDVYFTSFLLQ